MFNKFKSRKEEGKYEEMYKGTKDELFEEDLDIVVGGVHMSKEDIENNLRHDDEMSLEELDEITAGVPKMPEFDENKEFSEGTYINKYGEIVREGRSK